MAWLGYDQADRAARFSPVAFWVALHHARSVADHEAGGGVRNAIAARLAAPPRQWLGSRKHSGTTTKTGPVCTTIV